jgi:hypothetical protein
MGENVLVEGEQDERPIGIEVRVIEQGHEPISKPGSGICDISVVSIAAWCHEISIQLSISSMDVLAEVRSDEYPLRKGIITNLFQGEHFNNLETTNEMSSYIDSKVVKVPDTARSG